MKVVCISNGEVDGALDDYVNLTRGRVYDVIGENVSSKDHVFNIINDLGNRGSYHHGRFRTLEEVREKKLNELGIE